MVVIPFAMMTIYIFRLNKMVKFKLIGLVFLMFYLSCSKFKKQDVTGYWRLDYYDTICNASFPSELYFINDSLYTLNDYLYMSKLQYEVIDDSIVLKNSKGHEFKYEFKLQKEVKLNLNGVSFIKETKPDEFVLQNFELIGIKKGTVPLIPEKNDEIIYLEKNKDSFRILANNLKEISDLSSILADHRKQDDRLIIFLGKGIKIKDVMDLYCLLAYKSIYRVFLVTNSNEIDSCFGIEDKIRFLKIENQNELTHLNFKKINKLFKK